MKQTRKWLALALAGALSLSLLAGCAGNNTPDASSSSSTSQETQEPAAAQTDSDSLVIAEQGIFSAGGTVIESDGTFDVVIDQSGEAAETLCRAFCRAFHYDGLTFSLEGASGTAAALQTYNSAPVVNCTVTFTISDDRVTAVSGAHLPQEGQSVSGDGALSSLGALNAFLSTVQSGAVVTAVTDLYLCYELQSTIATPMALVPAWCIVTDTASYYVNCYTGTVSAG